MQGHWEKKRKQWSISISFATKRKMIQEVSLTKLYVGSQTSAGHKGSPLQKKGWWWYMILFFAHYPKEFNFIHGGNLLFWWPSSQLKLVQLLLLNLKVLGQLGLWPDTAWKNIAESISSWVFLFFFVLHCGTLNKVSWAQNSRTTLWCLLLTGVHLCN